MAKTMLQSNDPEAKLVPTSSYHQHRLMLFEKRLAEFGSIAFCCTRQLDEWMQFICLNG